MSGNFLLRRNILKNVTRRIPRIGVDAVLLNDEQNITYLTGFFCSGVKLLLLRNGKVLYFIDSMNRTLADEFVKNKQISIITVKGAFSKMLASEVKQRSLKCIGFDSAKFSVNEHKNLSKNLSRVKLVPQIGRMPISDIFSNLRMIKTKEEVLIIKEAARETKRIWGIVDNNINVGMTEIEIAALVDTEVLKAGYKNSFPTIAAVGRNTAYPHAVPTDERLKKNGHAMIDFGIVFKGYCSDLTRIHCNGRINRQIWSFLKTIEEIQNLAIREIKPGVEIKSVVDRTYELFEAKKLSSYLLHSLGHGIGIGVHEAPSFSASNEGVFEAGMILTVEPGLYKVGLGGVRKEDMVLVTSKGCEVLTR
ncbi:MAG: Xaa-Pro peptidase family protein [Candidatus Omnitrophica bacterium]|nr:Xaa-Pro peptidase family protein [Candidatus Omnitrophota bacterium]